MAGGYLSMKVTGFADLKADLAILGDKITKRIVAAAVRDASKIVVKAAKARVPTAKKPHFFYPYVRSGRAGRKKTRHLVAKGPRGSRLAERTLIQPGLVKRSIGIKKDKRGGRGQIAYYVGPIKKKGKGYAGDPFYWKWIEFGVPAHGIPARPFMRPAFQASHSAIINKMRESLTERVRKESLKLRAFTARAAA